MLLICDLITTFSVAVAFLALLYPEFDKFGLWSAKKRRFQYIVMCVATLSIIAAYVLWIRTKNVVANRFDKIVRHWYFLTLCLLIILDTIIFKIADVIIILEEKPFHLSKLKEFLNIIFVLPLLLLPLPVKNRKLNILPYAPVIIDIYDGLELLTSKSNETSLVWVHVAICLAVITFCIPAFLEIYHIKYPDERVLSGPSIRLAHFICGSIFLAVRMVVAVFTKNRHYLLFLGKGCLRLDYHYKTYVNLRRLSNIVQAEATEISKEEIASIQTGVVNWYHTGENINRKSQRCDEIRIAIDPDTKSGQGTKPRYRKRSQSF